MRTRCLGCMDEYDNAYGLCPVCGYEPDTDVESPIHMQPGVLLHGQYLIGRVLGFGGFGVTYIGWDFKLERKVAIKEYLPSEFATRLVGQTQVSVFGGKKEEQFGDGMDQFVQEAKRLAKFQNEEGIVQIYDSFAENNTAYIVMEYLDGETLTAYLERNQKIEPEQAIEMLAPVLRSLETVHNAGIIHRDIAPDNIFLTRDGKVKLIDFGAARYATTTHSRSLTVIIKPGYSPEEQYRSRGDQGPHTDVYALGAVLYRMVTGIALPDSMERRANFERNGKDIVVPISKNCKISKNHENAIMNALNVRIEDRTPTAARFLEELMAQRAVKRIFGKIKITDMMRWPLWAKICIPTAGVVAAALLVLLFIGKIGPGGNILTDITLRENETRVPGVVNDNLDVGENRLADQDLKLKIIGSQDTEDRIPPEVVIYQEVSAGRVVEKGSIVNVYVSVDDGELESGVMPNLVYKTLSQAEELMERVGLKMDVEEVFDDRVAEGLVVAQNKPAGMDVGGSGAIKVEVSKGEDPNKQVGTPELVVLSKTEYNLYIGDLVTLRAEGGTGKYSYTSTDESVLTVDRSGKVTAQSVGTATVVVSSGDAEEAECTISVQDYEMTLNKTELLLFIEGSTPLNALGIPANASVEWSSENSEIASVDPNGKVTGVAVGETVVTASWKHTESGKVYTAEAKILVEEQGITLGTSKISGFYVGDTRTIKANASSDVTSITWKSSNEKVAKVDQEGKVTAVGGGKATISATFGEYEATCDVTVIQPGVSFAKKQTTIYLGDSTRLNVSTTPSGAELTWESKDKSVVTVSNGTIKAVGAGTAKVTVKMTHEGKTYDDTCTVTVRKPDMTLSKSSISLKPDGSATLKATTEPSGQSVTWTSDNSDVVTVSGGKLTAVGAGTTKVRAKMSYNGHSVEKTCEVTVEKLKISLNESSVSMTPGESGRKLKATVNISGASVTWTSDNSNVVTVSNGSLTAVGAGSTTVRAKVSYKNQTREATCTVKVGKPSVTLDKESMTLELDGSGKLSATTVPASASVTWTSSNESVVTVSNGKVKAVGSGTAKITAKITVDGKTYDDSCEVTVEKPSISVTSSANTIEYSDLEKGSATLTAKVKPDNGGEITWAISDESIATLSSKTGKKVTVTAKSAGTVTVSATYTAGGITVYNTCELKVKKAASTLKINNFSYLKTGKLSEFWCKGTLTSNFELDRIECSGNAKSNALGITTPTVSGDTYYFADGLYEADLSKLTSFFVNQVEGVYTVYKTLADGLLADNSVDATITYVAYDKSGASVTQTIKVTVYD